MSEGSRALSIHAPFDGLALRLCSMNANYYKSGDESDTYRHSHQAYELHLVKCGSFTLLAGGDSYPVSQDGFVLIGPGHFHSSKEQSPDFDEYTFTFELPIKGAEPGADGRLVMEALSGIRILSGESAEVAQPCLALVRELEDRRQGFQVGARAAFLQLVLALVRYVVEPGIQASYTGEDLNQKRVFIIDSFFAKSFALRNGSQILAEQLGVSRRQLDRIIKDLYGASYREKLSQTRMEIAYELLHETSYSMAQIAERLGYGDKSSFHAAVRTATGKTPGQIRGEGFGGNLRHCCPKDGVLVD